jgi:hypothetical protein
MPAIASASNCIILSKQKGKTMPKIIIVVVAVLGLGLGSTAFPVGSYAKGAPTPHKHDDVRPPATKPCPPRPGRIASRRIGECVRAAKGHDAEPISFLRRLPR